VDEETCIFKAKSNYSKETSQKKNLAKEVEK